MASRLSEHKSLSAGVGVSILTTIASIFSTYFRAHAGWLIGAATVAVALVLWPIAHTLWSREKTSEPKTSNSVNSAGRDNTGRMVQAEVLNYYEASPQAVSVLPPQVPDPPPSESEFELKCTWNELVYDAIPGYWRVSNRFDYAKSPRKSLVASVIRQVPPRGSPHKDVKLSATVKFTRGSTFERQLSNAYWLNSEFSEQDFVIGHEGLLIIGSCEGDKFASYENRFPRFQYAILETISRPLGFRKSSSQRGTIDFEISLIDVLRKETVVQKKFSVIFNPKASPIIFEGL